MAVQLHAPEATAGGAVRIRFTNDKSGRELLACSMSADDAEAWADEIRESAAKARLMMAGRKG